MTAFANDHQIVAALEHHGPATARRLVLILGADADPEVHAAPDRIFGRLVQLVRQGRVECLGLPTLGAVYRPVRRVASTTRRWAA